MTEEEKKAIEYLKENLLLRIENEKIVAYGNSYKLILLNLIEKQQEEIVRLNRKQADDEMLTDTFIERDYISKDKIREKIKNIKENIETLNNSANFDSAYVQTELEYQRTKKEVLQELLEEN